MPDVQPRFKTTRRQKRSKMTQDAQEMRAARLALLERSGGRCEARFSELCTGVGVHAHHRKRRSQGGTNDPANLIWTCAPCHTKVHQSPAEALVAGLLTPGWA